MIVGYKHAAVQFTSKTTNLAEHIDAIRQISHEEVAKNTQLVINKIIISSRAIMQDVLLEHGFTAQDNVVYDRHKEKKGKGGRSDHADGASFGSLELSNECEVEMTLSNINIQDKDMLATRLTEILTQKLEVGYKLTGKVQVFAKTYMLMMCRTATKEQAECLCKKITTLTLKQHNCDATVKFKSKHHQLFKVDFDQKFKHLQIMDILPPHAQQDQQQPWQHGYSNGNSGGSSSSGNNGAAAAAAASENSLRL
jgi:hypothetical protein